MPWKIQTQKPGTGRILAQQFSLAKSDDALYYFCEDDYLHEKCAIHEMWAFYRQFLRHTPPSVIIRKSMNVCITALITVLSGP